MLALAVALVLAPPVDGGTVTRGFAYAGDPFAAGLHRGIDLAAERGEPVRAACPGRVTFAGRAGANGRTVTVRCGEWSVTHLPLESVATSAGATVRTGTRIGTAGPSSDHPGLHLGVRRTSDARGYVDPAPLLRTPAPPTGPARQPIKRPAPPPHHPEPSPFAPPTPKGSSPLAPWLAWAGLALALAGALGARTAERRRRYRAPLPHAKAAKAAQVP